ncbi:MAG TPA: branched-chain amino acid ABC transporter permease [Alphaproteobacteria bacterium]|nr:branched-chain amino acid ABC transporter permease [Alphaproteobacteria bacterium]
MRVGSRISRDWQTPLLLIALLVVVALLGSLAAPAMQRTVTEALVKLTVVIGLYIFVGNSGVFSFGHIAFMAIGGYISAILTILPAKKHVALKLPMLLEAAQLPGPVAMLIAIGVAGLIALAISLPFVRLKGIALPMATFALLVIVYVVALNWTAVTGGRQALVGLPRYTNLWIALAAASAALLVATAYGVTRHGLALRCSRESEVAAAATGIDVAQERRIAFVISAVIVAMGGVLFAHFLGTMTANTFYLDLTFVTLTMLVVGGMRSLTGACAGVAVVSIVSELFRSIERGIDLGGFTLSAPPGLQEIALALVLLVILLTRPHGLAGDWELTWDAVRGKFKRGE